MAVRARRDVQRIWADIVEDNPAAARRVVEKFTSEFEMLGRNPGAGRRRDELGPRLRSFPVYEYLILYREAEPGVQIVRVVHGRRDLVTLLR